MISSNDGPSNSDLTLLLNAYIDGELDAAATLDVERRLADNPQLRMELARLSALHTSIATQLHKDSVPDTLRRRIEDAVGSTSFQRPAKAFGRMSFDWRQMAACVILAAGLASGATYLMTRSDPESATLAAILAGHQRSLLSASPVDIASSDRHTVKPWFDTRLALSPLVPDLAPEGYPLAGGRVDIVGGKPVPTLVYRHRQHLISLTAIP